MGDGVFVGQRVLGNVRGMDGEGEAGLSEEFAAAGRGGGEDEHIGIIAGVVGSRAASRQVSGSAVVSGSRVGRFKRDS